MIQRLLIACSAICIEQIFVPPVFMAALEDPRVKVEATPVSSPVRMVAPLVEWQYFAGPVVLLVGLAAVLFAVAIRARRDREGREVVARLLTLGIVLLVIAIPFAVITYRQYVAINTFTYGYRLELRPNGTARDAIIVPIPGDEILVSALRVVSGTANWSIVDTGHGRGLYVAFTGNVSLDSSYSVFGESRFNHNDTPTMR